MACFLFWPIKEARGTARIDLHQTPIAAGRHGLRTVRVLTSFGFWSLKPFSQKVAICSDSEHYGPHLRVIESRSQSTKFVSACPQSTIASGASRRLNTGFLFVQGPKMPEYKHADSGRQIDVVALLIDLFQQFGQAKLAVLGDLA